MRLFLRHIPLMLAAVVILLALGACADDDGAVRQEPIPEGYGRLVLTIGTADALPTRAVSKDNTWIEGSEEERAIKSYHILICSGSRIVQTISGTNAELSGHDDADHTFPSSTTFTSQLMPVGQYDLTIYCLANFTADMMSQAGLAVSSAGDVTSVELPADFDNRAIKTTSTATLPTTGMPMTGKLTATVTIRSEETTTKDDSDNDLTLTLWRMMAKLQIDFINESGQQLDIMGMEVEPINDGTVGIPLWQPTVAGEATDAANSLVKVANVSLAPWTYATADEQPIATVPAKSGTTDGKKTMAVYINETDASYTAVGNQFSLRFKVRRKTNGTPPTEYTEYRYAITSPYVEDGTTTPATVISDGFNVIRRNDWVHLPIRFTDWQFQIEALPFPPIAGYQARMYTADAQSITFNSGGYIVIHPMFRKTTDEPTDKWRTFDDADVTCVLPSSLDDYDTSTLSGRYAEAITDGTGIVMEGDLDIFEQRFVKLPSGDIVGKLTNEDNTGTVTITLRVKLGTPPLQYSYQFTYNIIKV